LSRGIVRLRLTSPAPLSAFDAVDRRIIERAPADWRTAGITASPDAISRRLRDAFDPQRIFNRGISARRARDDDCGASTHGAHRHSPW
jgi:hypothetical protein